MLTEGTRLTLSRVYNKKINNFYLNHGTGNGQ